MAKNIPLDCICTSKVTKFKANNNIRRKLLKTYLTVFAQAKLLNLKQITTWYGQSFRQEKLYLHKQSY